MENSWSRVSSVAHETSAQQGFSFFGDAGPAFEFHPRQSSVQWSTSTLWHDATQTDPIQRVEEINDLLETASDEAVLPPLHTQDRDQSSATLEAQVIRQASQSMGPPVNSRKRKAPTLRESDWAPVKSRVIELYYQKDLPVNKVKEAIERDPEFSGFKATIRQYKSRLDQWRVGKNIKTEEMKNIVRKRQRRALHEPEKNEFRFRVRDRPVPAGQINRWMKQHKGDLEMLYPSSPVERPPSAVSASTISTKGSPVCSQATVAAVWSMNHGSSRSTKSCVPSPILSLSSVDLAQRSTFTGQSPKIEHGILISGHLLDLRILLSLPMPVKCATPTFKNKEEAEARQFFHASEARFGSEHFETLHALHRLGDILSLQGRYAACEVIREKSLLRCRSALGESHARTLNAAVALGALYGSQGRYDRCEQLLRETSRRTIEILGSEHRASIECMLFLGSVLFVQGRLNEAEAVVAPLLVICRRLFGANDELTLANKSQLGEHLLRRGRLDEARLLFEEVLSSRALGLENRIYRSAMHDLAQLSLLQGNYHDAEMLLKKLIFWENVNLGLDHPDTLDTLHALARLLGLQGRLEIAAEVMSSIIATSTRILGAEHPDVLTMMHDLAGLLVVLQRSDEAERHYKDLLAISEQVLRPSYPLTLYSLNAFAGLLSARSRWDEAIILQVRACEGAEMEYGPRHSVTLSYWRDYRATLALRNEQESKFVHGHSSMTTG